MSVVKNSIAIALTLVLLVAGFFLPDALSRFQDSGNASSITSYEANNLSLALQPSHEITDTLALFSQSYSLIELEEGKKLTAESAYDAAIELLVLLKQNGFEDFDTTGYGEHSEQALLAVSDSDAKAVLLWRCTISGMDDDNTVLSFLIDDENGKVVDFESIQPVDYLFDATTQEEKTLDWSDFWASYLDIDLEIILPDDEQGNTAVTQGEQDSSVQRVRDLSVLTGITSEKSFALEFSYMVVAEDNAYTHEEALEEPLDTLSSKTRTSRLYAAMHPRSL